MNIFIRQCVIGDLSTLQEISYRTYNETFMHANTPTNMKAYLQQAFDIEKLRGELLNCNSTFYFLYTDDQLSGYLKLNESNAQTDIYDLESLEIERIYITKEFQGKGLGSFLMNKAIDVAKFLEKLYVWLGVWEKNDKANLFYKNNDFYVISSHSFLWEKTNKQIL